MNYKHISVRLFDKVWLKLLAYFGEDSKIFHAYHDQKNIHGMRIYAKKNDIWNNNFEKSKIIL